MARPLELHAAQSTISLQPAAGRRSPRIFLFLDPLILSVVPEGTGRELLEFGELRSETRSVKAEIKFPVENELTERAPFERVLFGETGTTCGACHRAEAMAENFPFEGAFISQALRPLPNQRVNLSELGSELLACDTTLNPQRCAMLKSIFGEGDVQERDFPTVLDTF